MNGRVRLLPALLLALALTGCDLVGDVFEAGVWIGVLVVIVVLVLVAWVLFQVFD